MTKQPKQKLVSPKPASIPNSSRRKALAKPVVELLQAEPEQLHVPYDENLLERARIQWQFGDWQSLAQLNRDALQHHPDRAKLALLAAAGRLQTTSSTKEAKQFIRLALDWGVSKKLIGQILIAGVHNSIGRAAAVSNQRHRALQHFEKAITIGTPGSDTKLLSKARIGEQLQQVGLESDAIPCIDVANILSIQEGDFSDTSILEATAHKSRDQLHEYWRSSQQDPLGYVNADNKRSLRLVEIFRQYVGPGRILEIGTNAGRNLYHLYAAGFVDLEGIEISPVAVAMLRAAYSDLSDIPIHVGAVEDFIGTFSDKSFECVFTMAVLEHIHDDSDWIFSHIARIARCVITIEDELRSGERHFSRNYERVFTRFGMRQVHLEDRTKWGLPSGFAARVFVTHSKS